MLRSYANRFGWLLVLTLGLWVPTAQAEEHRDREEHRYRYVSLDQIELPSGFLFFDPIAINNSGLIYGNAYDAFVVPHVAVYANGAMTVYPEPGVVNAANNAGTVGGSVLIDPSNFIEQAALFHKGQVQLIPRQPGEVTSSVTALNDSGVALVTSLDAVDKPTYVLYRNGRATVLDFGLTNTPAVGVLHINNQGIISGTAVLRGIGYRGFRFDPRSGKTTLLDPLPTEPSAWALDINARGDVLGYSFVSGGLERIGVWNREAEFETYFVEGTAEFPTVSNHLLFNDKNLIVITFVSSPASELLRNSYLVPKPGVRLNLAELVENLPSQQTLGFIIGMNNRGDLIGLGGQGSFLLDSSGGRGSMPHGAAALPYSSYTGMEAWRQTMRAAAATMPHAYKRPPGALK